MARSYRVLGRMLEALQRTNSYEGMTHSAKASVAAVFRLAHPHAYMYSHVPPSECINSVEDLMRYFEGNNHTEQHWTEDAQLQLLFMKRSVTPLDRHSGQIAFPGGKKEKNESQLQCAIRETRCFLVREEIGLKLDDHKDFAYMGHLNEIFLPKRLTRTSLALSTHGKHYSVFVQLTPVTPPVSLCKREVGSYRWVDFRTFTQEFQHRFQPVEMEIQGQALGPWSRAVNLMSNGKLRIKYAGIDLPPADSHVCDGLGDRPDTVSKYLLWGITYGRIRALVKCVHHEDKTNRERDWSIYTCERPWQVLAPVMRGVDLLFGPEKVNPKWVLGTVLIVGTVGVSVGLAAGVSYVV